MCYEDLEQISLGCLPSNREKAGGVTPLSCVLLGGRDWFEQLDIINLVNCLCLLCEHGLPSTPWERVES